MVKRAKRYRGMSSTKGGELLFTVNSLGSGNFHLKISEIGQYYLFDGFNREIPKNWNDDQVLKTLLEIIDCQIFNGEFRDVFYRVLSNSEEDDIPF